MNSPRRVFFGLPLTQESRSRLAEVVSKLRTACASRGIRARWVAPENWHSTLKFMGHVTSEVIESLAEEASRLTSLESLDTEWRGLGAFPSARRARVVVAHLRDPEQTLAKLAQDFEQLGALHGITPEQRTYRPHLTLARVGRVADFSALFDTLPLTGPLQLGPVTLYESHLEPSGSRYEPLWTSYGGLRSP